MSDELIRIDELDPKATLASADVLAIDDSEDLNAQGLKKSKKITGQTILDVATSGADASMGLYRNAIINPIDENMPDQYGLTGTSVSDNEYAIDRWKLVESQTSNPTFTKNTDNIKIESNETSSSILLFQQIVEDVNYDRLKGLEVTLSAKVTSNSSDCSIRLDDGVTTTESSKHTGGGSEETLSLTKTISASASVLSITMGLSNNGSAVSITTGDYIQFKHAQLTLGNTVLPYQPRHYGQELALCQRYALEITGDDGGGGDGIIGSGIGASGTLIRVPIYLPHQFIDVPNTLVATAGDWQVWDTAAVLAVTGISLNSETSKSVASLDITVASGVTQYRPYFLMGDAVAGRKMLISSEL